MAENPAQEIKPDGDPGEHDDETYDPRVFPFDGEPLAYQVRESEGDEYSGD